MKILVAVLLSISFVCAQAGPLPLGAPQNQTPHYWRPTPKDVIHSPPKNPPGTNLLLGAFTRSVLGVWLLWETAGLLERIPIHPQKPFARPGIAESSSLSTPKWEPMTAEEWNEQFHPPKNSRTVSSENLDPATLKNITATSEDRAKELLGEEAWDDLESIEKERLLQPFVVEGLYVDPLELYIGGPAKVADAINQIGGQISYRLILQHPNLDGFVLPTENLRALQILYPVMRIILTDQSLSNSDFNAISYKPTFFIQCPSRDIRADGIWHTPVKLMSHDIVHILNTTNVSQIFTRSKNNLVRKIADLRAMESPRIRSVDEMEIEVRRRKAFWKGLEVYVNQHAPKNVRDAFDVFWFEQTHENFQRSDVWSPKRLMNERSSLYPNFRSGPVARILNMEFYSPKSYWIRRLTHKIPRENDFKEAFKLIAQYARQEAE